VVGEDEAGDSGECSDTSSEHFTHPWCIRKNLLLHSPVALI